jgi:hypothetical protein
VLEGQDEKRNSFDFAYGKKLNPSISCGGLPTGATVSPAGTSNVQP